MAPSASIIVRCKDELWALERLFPLLAAQDYAGEVEVVLVDSGSTDGSRELDLPPCARRILLEPEAFSYGRALNVGLAAAAGEYAVLLSAHCFPLARDWLARLVCPLAEPRVALAFGRQVGRADLNPAEALRLARDYPARGPSRLSFSNANAAARRAYLLAHPFDEELPIGEEAPLVRAVRAEGLTIRYVPEAAVEHAHPGLPSAAFRRAWLEGWVLEREVRRGRRPYGPPWIAARTLAGGLAAGWAQLSRPGRALRAAFLEALQRGARDLGGRAARRGRRPEPPEPRILARCDRLFPAPPPRLGFGGPFTLGQAPEDEAKVRRDLRAVRAAVLEAVPGLEALYLCGGFGRGEGRLEGPAGARRPANDYDFELLCTRPPPRAELQALGRRLAARLGLRWLDLEAHGPRELRRLVRCTQYGFDLAAGHRLLWHAGRPLPELAPPRALPWLEGRKVLAARLWALLACAPPAARPDLFAQQAEKAVLALADALLIRGRTYACRYADKERRLAARWPVEAAGPWFRWAFARRLGRAADAAPPGGFFELRALYLGLWERLEGRPPEGACDGRARADFAASVARLLKPRAARARRARTLAYLALLRALRPGRPPEPELFARALARAAALGYAGEPEAGALARFLLGPKLPPAPAPVRC